VLRAKARELEEAGAEVPEGAFDLAFEDEEGGGGEEGERRETDEERQRKTKKRGVRKAARFPLRASSYVAVPADVSKPGALARALERVGHDRTRPTVFVAEGLLMYLGAEGASTCLSAAAEACPPSSGASSSSTLLAVTITPSALTAARERSRRRQLEGIDVASTDLLASWNFGCDARGLPALCGGSGWSSQIDAVVSRSDMARRYRPLIGNREFEYEVVDAGTQEARGSLFFVARK